MKLDEKVLRKANAIEMTLGQNNFTRRMALLLARHRVFSDNTFGTIEERGPIGPILHMKKELEELISKPNDILEYADVLLLLLDAMARGGFDILALLGATETKQIVNETRDWPKWNDPNKPVEHIRLGEAIGGEAKSEGEAKEAKSEFAPPSANAYGAVDAAIDRLKEKKATPKLHLFTMDALVDMLPKGSELTIRK